MNCGNCGKDVGDFIYCPYCGKEVLNSEQNNSDSTLPIEESENTSNIENDKDIVSSAENNVTEPETTNAPKKKKMTKKRIIKLVFWGLLAVVVLGVGYSIYNTCDYCIDGLGFCFDCDYDGYNDCTNCEDGIVDCSNCKDGIANCSNCKGKGKELCKDCKGSGSLNEKTLVSCYICHGAGYLVDTCSTCSARGWILASQHMITCPSCSGSGHKTRSCAICNSSGTVSSFVDCPTCNGTGCTDETCKSCSGEGKEPCSVCSGSEKITCPECQKTLKVKCEKCNGTGRIKCEYCDGTGKKNKKK